jgi:adenine deaminase
MNTPQQDVALLQRRIRVALGTDPADLLLTDCQIVNVFTRRVEPANIALVDGWIAGAGPYDWPARQKLPLEGRVVLPGLIDSHMHLESTLLTPVELARLVLPHGTTAVISDSHEIGNVLGTPGIDLLLEASEDLPLDLFLMASSCVPATSWEHAGATLGPDEVAALLDRPRVLGLAEVMDIPAVLSGDPTMLAKLQRTLARQRVLDGHAPAMVGRSLQAYACPGIRSCHESATAEEARQKAAIGMLVQVREGSSALNLETLLPLLNSGDLGDRWTLVTDDIFPDDLHSRGHIDGLLKRVVAAGVPAAAAVRQASFTPAQHYGLNDRGAIAPGYRADLFVVDDLRDFRPYLTLKNGQVVSRNNRFAFELKRPPLRYENSVHLPRLDESAFRLAIPNTSMPVIRILPGQLLTKCEPYEVARQDGWWQWDPSRDVVLIASIERHRALGTVGVGLVAGFNFRHSGALASSVAHDSHNIIVAGTNARDMLTAVRAVAETGGGFVAAAEGTVLARLPLPLAGLLSVEPFETVCEQLHAVYGAARLLGCELASPFGTLSFLALPVIPEVRVTDQGMFDVLKQRFLTGKAA